MKYLMIIWTLMNLTSCSDVDLVAPLCGPRSYDSRPVERFPDEVTGCYEVPSGTLGTQENINGGRGLNADREYIHISKVSGKLNVKVSRSFPRRLIVRLPADNFMGELLGICRVRDQILNFDRLFLYSVDPGRLTELEFSPDGKKILIGFHSLSHDRLQQSGLPFSMHPSMGARMIRPDGTADTFPIDSDYFGGSVDRFAIDNRSVSPEELLRRLSVQQAKVAAVLRKVDASLCKSSVETF